MYGCMYVCMYVIVVVVTATGVCMNGAHGAHFSIVFVVCIAD